MNFKTTTITIGMFAYPFLALSYGTQYVDNYIVRRTNQETSVSSRVENVVLVDENNDGILDRKYTAVACRRGYITHDLALTQRDEEIFSDITSRL